MSNHGLGWQASPAVLSWHPARAAQTVVQKGAERACRGLGRREHLATTRAPALAVPAATFQSIMRTRCDHF